MRQREAVQLVPAQAPLRHHTIHVAQEATVVMTLQEMYHFMDQNELEALRWLLGQLEVQPNPPGVDVARAPARLHPFDTPIGHINTDEGLPLDNQLWDPRLELLTVPGVQHRFAPGCTRTRPDVEIHSRGSGHPDKITSGMADDVQSVAAPPNVVTLAGDHFTLGLAGLKSESGALTPDPTEFRDNREMDGIVVHAQRNSHANPPVGGVNGKMKVLDRFPVHFDGDAADGKNVGFSSHAGS